LFPLSERQYTPPRGPVQYVPFLQLHDPSAAGAARFGAAISPCLPPKVAWQDFFEALIEPSLR